MASCLRDSRNFLDSITVETILKGVRENARGPAAGAALAVVIALLYPGGRRPNGFLGLSFNVRTILFLVILLDKTVSVG